MKAELLLPGIAQHFGMDLPKPKAKAVTERTEHAGGAPEVTLEFDAEGERVGGSPVTEFDYEAIYAALDSNDPERRAQAKEAVMALARRFAVGGFLTMMQWAAEECVTLGGIQVSPDAARRVKSALVINYFSGQPLTYEQVGNQCGMARQHVHEIWRDFTSRFPFVDRKSRAKATQARQNFSRFNQQANGSLERELQENFGRDLTDDELAEWARVKAELV